MLSFAPEARKVGMFQFIVVDLMYAYSHGIISSTLPSRGLKSPRDGVVIISI